MKTPTRFTGSLALLFCLSLPLSRAGAATVDTASPPDLAKLSASAEQELRGDILPFWLKYTRNPENGGFVGMITADMKVKNNVPRGALLTSRILWTFSTAYRVYHDPAYLEMARYAYNDLAEHFWDKENGGLYWAITPDGKSQASDAPDVAQRRERDEIGFDGRALFHRSMGDDAAKPRVGVGHVLNEGGLL